jgi:hypothetical protein
MKNTRNTLFVATAALAAGLLAALCSGCDGAGPGEGSEVGDAGRVDVGGVARGDAGRSDAVRVEATAAGDARATSCQVPEPKFSLNGLVSTTPRKGYRVVNAENVQCISTISATCIQPTNCADPVDGFASSADQPWFCMVTQKMADDTYEVVGPILREMGKDTMFGSPGPGGIALCSRSGAKFLGWACN